MTIGYIYKIDFPNGKIYIGLTTTSLQKRKNTHKSCAKNGSSHILYKALRKYNMVDTFKLIKIDSADTQEELCNKEMGYIQQYDSYYKNGKGYNMTLGGEGVFGYEHTTEDRQKMSDAQKKYYQDNPEARQKNSDAQKKYYQDNPEARQKILNTKGKNKPFDVFKKDGTFIKTFTYQCEAREYLQEEFNIKSTILIGRVLRGKQNTSAGFKFKYKE